MNELHVCVRLKLRILCYFMQIQNSCSINVCYALADKLLMRETASIIIKYKMKQISIYSRSECISFGRCAKTRRKTNQEIEVSIKRIINFRFRPHGAIRGTNNISYWLFSLDPNYSTQKDLYSIFYLLYGSGGEPFRVSGYFLHSIV